MSELVDRAERWGVQASYEDFRGQPRLASPEVIEAILDALGAGDEEPPETTARVVRTGERAELPDVRAIELEEGGSVAVEGLLPEEVPSGYHRAVASDGHRSRLIVSPGTCFLPKDLRAWGWAVQLYALRSHSSWGMGDLADLERFGRWSRSTGAGLTLVNPLFAVGPSPQQEPSPYFPTSRRFYNHLYLRIEDVPGAGDLQALDTLTRAGRGLNDTDLIERDEIHRLKSSALERIYETGPDSPHGFDAFQVEQGATLEAFATFMALAEHHGGGPSSWPAEYSHPSSLAVRRFEREHAGRIRFHKWVQFVIDEQLHRTSSATDLVHDLPVGSDGDGADAWIWQDVYARTMRVGAPPDEFNTGGQDWGFPPMSPWQLAAADYEPFIQALRGGFRNGAGLRIDHVMGLFRLFWIPEGATPSEGAYVLYPHRELLDIVALESHRAKAFVIGEDLGTVEGHVRDEMAARSMLSYKLMWFEHDPPSRFPELALAAITNHDVPTVAGMWTGSDLMHQEKLGLNPDAGAAEALRSRAQEMLGVADDAAPDEVIERAVTELAGAPSKVVVATLEDALAMTDRPNMPGTVSERPNWSIPLPKTMEEIERDPQVAKLAGILTEGRA
jgi:4-alpha-glucanotransferase